MEEIKKVVKKPVSPSKRGWVGVAIRREAYTKLCAMAQVDNRTIGGEMTWLIDTAHEQLIPQGS